MHKINKFKNDASAKVKSRREPDSHSTTCCKWKGPENIARPVAIS